MQWKRMYITWTTTVGGKTLSVGWDASNAKLANGDRLKYLIQYDGKEKLIHASGDEDAKDQAREFAREILEAAIE